MVGSFKLGVVQGALASGEKDLGLIFFPRRLRRNLESTLAHQDTSRHVWIKFRIFEQNLTTRNRIKIDSEDIVSLRSVRIKSMFRAGIELRYITLLIISCTESAEDSRGHVAHMYIV